MLVRVKEGKTGFDGLQRRTEGERFMWPAGVPLGSWVEVVASAEEPAPEPKPEKPKARAGKGKPETTVDSLD